FAHATGQSFHLYHSLDYFVNNKSKLLLKNAAADAAWNAPTKKANNLYGHLPLVPGMPVFLTDNIATEIGLSNGCEGTLVSLKYEVAGNKRYAASVDVDFPSYHNPNKVHQHRVTL
ncbi:hypothetical protein M422DRAFT_126760, partial [Sphaerobolus stellatus SS14]